MRFALAFIAFVAVLTAASVSAADAGRLRVEAPVLFRAFEGARAAGGYMAVRNEGAADDVLTGVRVTGAAAMIHESREADGVVRMEARDAVPIPAGETVVFAPGGLHVMVMGLGRDVGETLEAVLIFERAGEVAVAFEVTDEAPR